MQTVQNISNDAKQKHTVTLDDGRLLVLQLNYAPTQMGWFLDIEIEGFVLRGIRVATNPNLLFQWHNLISFGIMCEVDGNQESLSIEDFLVGRATLSILTQDEVNEFIKQLSQLEFE